MPLLIVEKGDGRIAVSSPYHPSFPIKARTLGGIWDAAQRLWIFDAGDRDRVKSLCREIYGTDGGTDGQEVGNPLSCSPGPPEEGRVGASGAKKGFG